MLFYVVQVETTGETIGCELTKRAAYEYAESRGYSRAEVEVVTNDVPVTPESIRRLLGNLGGYANI